MKKPLLLVTFALCATVCVAPVEAQTDGVFDMGYLTRGLSYGASAKLYGERDAARLKGKGRRGTRGVRGAGSVTRGKAPRVSTRFRPSLAARRAVLARLVAQTRAADPAAATRLQNSLGGADPIAPLMPTLSRYGLRADDAADAMALYLVVAWYGSRGLDQDPPLHLMRAVRNQMRNALPNLPAFARASNAAKQQMADAMWIQTLVAASSLGAAKGKPALMNQTKQAIRQGAMKAFKLDMTKLKLTSNGLRA